MSITTLDELINALGNNSQRVRIEKASIANMAAGNLCSLWRAAGTPGQGANPASAAVCNAALPGCLSFTNPSGGQTAYLSQFRMAMGLTFMDYELHDRLAHMGALSGTVTTAQTVGVDASDSALVDRIGESDFSDVQWYLEWYQDTGATAVTATVNLTLNDNTTTTASVALAATRRASLLLPFSSPTAGKFIKSVQSVTLSATTGTAGSFGVTCSRIRAVVPGMATANWSRPADAFELGLPKIPADACLHSVVWCTGTSTGATRGGGKISMG